MKRISSERAKSTQISTKTKTIVFDRDSGRCILCGRRGLPSAHYVPRAFGGCGKPENIVTLCNECHERFDHGDAEDMETIGKRVREYLSEHYPEIEYPEDRYHPGECELVYQKYGGKL